MSTISSADKCQYFTASMLPRWSLRSVCALAWAITPVALPQRSVQSDDRVAKPSPGIGLKGNHALNACWPSENAFDCLFDRGAFCHQSTHGIRPALIEGLQICDRGTKGVRSRVDRSQHHLIL